MAEITITDDMINRIIGQIYDNILTDDEGIRYAGTIDLDGISVGIDYRRPVNGDITLDIDLADRRANFAVASLVDIAVTAWMYNNDYQGIASKLRKRDVECVRAIHRRG